MPNKYWWIAAALIGVASLAIVAGNASPESSAATSAQQVQIVATFPHDANSFSQGLVVEGETIYEGTGKYGASVLRQIDLTTGTVTTEVPLDERFFGEGITIFGNRIYQLTWKERACLVYDKETLKFLGSYQYAGEGWGLTDDEKYLYMSDGSSTLQVLDPKTMKVIKRLPVKEGRRRIEKLNELEFVDGEIYANIWYSDQIARIDPKTGKVLGWLDCGSIYPMRDRPDREHVLNGIAYDPKTKRLFVTGKYWPKLYEIKVRP